MRAFTPTDLQEIIRSAQARLDQALGFNCHAAKQARLAREFSREARLVSTGLRRGAERRRASAVERLTTLVA